MEERIGDWYGGRSVLVTGGTGFMGKVLVEKLLRSCPDIGTVFILCRSKHGKTPVTRIAEAICKPPVFERLSREDRGALNKVEPVEGDVTVAGLGLSPAAAQRLRQEVSVVFHLAASLRLEAPLRPAVDHNTRGTLHLLEFCTTAPHLKVVVHLSTAFCHPDQAVLEERFYPWRSSPRQVIQSVDSLDDKQLEAVTPELLGVHPNCYTLTKRLAESLVNEYHPKLPVIILRPSIVTPAMYEPVPGFVDSLNGPVGILVAAGKGVLRTMLVEPSNRAETVPVDIAVNSIIAIAAKHKHRTDKPEETVPCYNISSGEIVPVTWGEVLERGKKQFYKYPFEAGLWYPGGTIRTNPYTHAMALFLLQTVPAYFIDFLMVLFRQKTFMVRIQDRIKVGLGVLQYFTTRRWDIRVERGVQEVAALMHPEDKKVFYIDDVDKDVDRFLKKTILGARQYCLKEPLSSLPAARIQLALLWLLDLTVKIFLMYGVYMFAAKILVAVNPDYKLPLPSELYTYISMSFNPQKV